MEHYVLSLWAKRFNLRYGCRHLPATIFLTDCKRIPDPAKVIRHLPKNSLVIIRDYGIPNRADYVKNLVALSRRYGHKIVVAGDETLAIRYKADGVHFPERDIRQAAACKRKCRNRLVSVAAHSSKTLYKAHKAGLDFVLLSPIFPTESHPGAGNMGYCRFRNLLRLCQAQPVYPLGGITGYTIPRLKTVPIPGIAAIGGYAG